MKYDWSKGVGRDTEKYARYLTRGDGAPRADQI